MEGCSSKSALPFQSGTFCGCIFNPALPSFHVFTSPHETLCWLLCVTHSSEFAGGCHYRGVQGLEWLRAFPESDSTHRRAQGWLTCSFRPVLLQSSLCVEDRGIPCLYLLGVWNPTAGGALLVETGRELGAFYGL